MDWCVSPAGTCPFPGPSPFFLPSLWRIGDGSLPTSHSPWPRKSPFPSLPQEAKEGEGAGGAGLPLGTAVAQSISPKPRNFLLPKRKKKKKKSQRPPFLPAPLGQMRLDLWGFPGGWLRAGTLSGKSGGVPWQALRQAHFGLLPSPPLLPLQVNHQRWPSPAPRSLGYGPGGQGPGGGAVQPWRGWGCGGGPGLPHTVSSALPSPELGISFHKLLWGHFFPSSKVCAIIFSCPSCWEG